MGLCEKLGLPVGGGNPLLRTIPEACPVLERPASDWELEGRLWTIGVLHREKVPGIDVLVEVMVVVVEETSNPTIGEDPIPKSNVVQIH